MNGKLISTSGIVLKPGVRVYLERFLDTPKHFAFETYVVDGSDSQAVAAITQNGDIVVDFYDEDVPVPKVIINDYQPLYRQYNSLNGNTVNCFYSNSSSLVGTVTSASMENSIVKQSRSLKETGRVEQGSHSNQEFKQYNGKFESFARTVVHLKLLPFSEKPFEIQDLAEYCTNCGTRNKKGNYNYCPKCGHKF